MLPPRCCHPLTEGARDLKTSQSRLVEKSLCQKLLFLALSSPKVSAGFLCWSAGNQVSLFLWLTLISFCWQQSVAKCPAAFQKLPTNARAPGRRKVMSACCRHEPGWTLRGCNAQGHRSFHVSITVLLSPFYSSGNQGAFTRKCN